MAAWRFQEMLKHLQAYKDAASNTHDVTVEFALAEFCSLSASAAAPHFTGVLPLRGRPLASEDGFGSRWCQEERCGEIEVRYRGIWGKRQRFCRRSFPMLHCMSRILCWQEACLV